MKFAANLNLKGHQFFYLPCSLRLCAFILVLRHSRFTNINRLLFYTPCVYCGITCPVLRVLQSQEHIKRFTVIEMLIS